MRKVLGLAGLLVSALIAFPGFSLASDYIDVVALDETRRDDDGYNFATGIGYQKVRDLILDTDNFGPSGVINRSVNITSISAFTAEALAGADVIVFNGANAALASEEISAVSSFVNDGGGFFAFSNWVAEEFSTPFGATQGEYLDYGAGDDAGAETSNASSPLINGPFGIFPDDGDNTNFDDLYTGWSGSFADIGPNGTEAMINMRGVYGASFVIGNGRVVMFTDEELFLNGPIEGAWAAFDANPARAGTLFLNSFAYAASGQGQTPPVVPEPSSILLLASGLLGLAAKRRRFKS